MGSYRPLFDVQVGHRYFSSGQWRGLDFVPTADTARMMQGADVLARPTAGGLALFCNDEKLKVLRLYATGNDPAVAFRFKVQAADRTFANYTAPLAGDPGTIPFLDGSIAEDEADGGARRYRLSKDAAVSGKDMCGANELIERGILTERDRRAPPDFVVEVRVTPPATGGSESDGSAGTETMPHYYCDFAARSSIWRYFLMGNLGGDSPSIVDPDNRVEFEQGDDTLLAGNRPARVFRSKDAIPLQEMPACRFQLKTQGNAGARVLIKRLPVASKSRLGMDEVDGKKQIVFENYINF